MSNSEKRNFMTRLTDEEVAAIEDKESKIYYVIYYATGEGEELKSWEKCVGRTETYEFIKSMIEYMDLDESLVLVSGLPFDKSKTAYEFMKFIEEKCKDVADPLFHIDDYVCICHDIDE